MNPEAWHLRVDDLPWSPKGKISSKSHHHGTSALSLPLSDQGLPLFSDLWVSVLERGRLYLGCLFQPWWSGDFVYIHYCFILRTLFNSLEFSADNSLHENTPYLNNCVVLSLAWALNDILPII